MGDALDTDTLNNLMNNLNLIIQAVDSDAPISVSTGPGLVSTGPSLVSTGPRTHPLGKAERGKEKDKFEKKLADMAAQKKAADDKAAADAAADVLNASTSVGENTVEIAKFHISINEQDQTVVKKDDKTETVVL